MSTENNNKNLIVRFQNFLSGYKGKVILNYAYSWGAAIVIMGALFKLTHLPGANLMLWVGMGTEVLVFFISAFDVPAKSSGNEQNSSNISVNVTGDMGLTDGVLNVTNSGSHPVPPVIIGGGVQSNIGGGMPIPESVNPSAAIGNSPIGTVYTGGPVYSGGGGYAGGGSYAGGLPSSGGSGYSGGGNSPLVTPEMEEATAAYLDQLKQMTEMIGNFSKQAESLSNDAEQMNTLNKNLSGINAIYEIQLRSISSQIGTIDQVHEQTRKMAQQIEELNAVYARMLDAMNGSK